MKEAEMIDWEKEIAGLTNLSGMHDEEYEGEGQEEDALQPDPAQPGIKPERDFREKSPLLYRLGYAQYYSEHGSSRDFYRKLQFILVRSDYTTSTVKKIQKLKISLLKDDLIGMVVGAGKDWSAYYLTQPGQVEARRRGYASADQAIHHIIVIYKNWRKAR